METIREAKDHLRSNFQSGTNCPCCGQTVKLYKRQITSSMAYGLILLCKEPIDEYIHLENFFKTKEDIPSSIRGDITKLRYWKMIEKSKIKPENQSNSSGMYKVTEYGMQFALGKVLASKFVEVFDGRIYGYSEEKVDIHEALTNRFDYEKLMNE